ncbi:MAG: MotA/TolQ/ExbB proton channel family protein [Leptospiraceae bacterium]|nr:MotA/TolQ/ExbB proton channel family protein [Leptospiraceae bacterium]MCP5511318.1 MotA/TolQ/ExbB proton channel family protein [Leptospiraceae bacterium]
MYTTYLGLILAFFSVLLAIVLEGAAFTSFFKLSAILLILGGTLGATIASYSSDQVQVSLKIMKNVLNEEESIDIYEIFLRLLDKTRRDGLLSLEDDIEGIPHELIQKGIRLIVDGTDPVTVEEILFEWTDQRQEAESISAKILETAGGFSPTIGIIGTVMGLVHVLENLGAGTSALGKGIATAFIATFYGIGFANLVFLPLSNKVKSYSREQNERRHAIIRGILSIQSGDNRRIMMERMAPYIHKY